MNTIIESTIITTENFVNPRTLIIRDYKQKIKTVKPVIDKYGTVYQRLFLYDYIIYALLRNKQDFTSCSSTNRDRAIELAEHFEAEIKKYLSIFEHIGEDKASPYLPMTLGEIPIDKKEFFTQLLVDIKESFNRVEEKYNLKTGV